MEKRNVCDMRGMLSFQILCLLEEKDMHGDDIAKLIGERRGTKPTAGTIYPALKDLSNKNLIKGEKQGKLIIYSLTHDGKKTVKDAKEYFCRCFGDIFENAK